jgi:hypothetical protein
MRHQEGRPLRRFERLSRLGDYEVEPHQVDPRGWNIVGPGGRDIGEVKDVLVDTETMTARYLDVELDTSAFDLGDDPHVIVPIQHAHREGDRKKLIVDNLSAARVAELYEAREKHQMQFWDQWWGSGPAGSEGSWSTRVSRRVPPDELHRIIDEVRPGERVRIPVVSEEVVVERRPVHSDELITARERDMRDPRTRDER